MSLLARSPEELARAVLRRLPPESVFGIRDRAREAPVSRGTVAKWDAGNFSMQKQVRRAVIEWLIARGVDDATLEAEQAREAAGESDLGPGSLWVRDQTGTHGGRSG